MCAPAEGSRAAMFAALDHVLYSAGKVHPEDGAWPQPLIRIVAFSLASACVRSDRKRDGGNQRALMPEDPSGNNRRAVADYQCSVRGYVATVNGRPSASAEALRRLAARVAPGACVLEIGSGPGGDADALEALGIDVHRTDVTAAFCDFQAERGKRCDRLDLLTDRIDARYGGAMMLCVLQHFEEKKESESTFDKKGAK